MFHVCKAEICLLFIIGFEEIRALGIPRCIQLLCGVCRVAQTDIHVLLVRVGNV